MKQFLVGQKVVHQTHGVGKISRIEKRRFQPEGPEAEFYIIDIPYDGDIPKRVFVPVESADRLRAVSTAKQSNDLLEFISSYEPNAGGFDGSTWNRRYRIMMELIHSGQAEDVAKVFKTLHLLDQEKELSFGERKLFDQAKNLLIAEIEASGVSGAEDALYQALHGAHE